MPKTDAQRRAQNKYQAAHYTNISVKVTKQYAAAVKAAAAAAGLAPAAIIKQSFDRLLLSQGVNPSTLAAAPDPGDNDSKNVHAASVVQL